MVRGRADALHGRERFDVVTSRAVAPLDRLLGWSMPLVAAPDGVLVAMKGSSAEDEIDAARDVLASLGCAAPEVCVLGEGRVPSPARAVRVAWAAGRGVGWPLAPERVSTSSGRSERRRRRR